MHLPTRCPPAEMGTQNYKKGTRFVAGCSAHHAQKRAQRRVPRQIFLRQWQPGAKRVDVRRGVRPTRGTDFERRWHAAGARGGESPAAACKPAYTRAEGAQSVSMNEIKRPFEVPSWLWAASWTNIRIKIAKNSGVSPRPMLRTHFGRGQGSRSVIFCRDCAILSNDSYDVISMLRLNNRFAARRVCVKGPLSAAAAAAAARGGERGVRVTHCALTLCGREATKRPPATVRPILDLRGFCLFQVCFHQVFIFL